MNEYNVVGIMSGTSLDGLDMAYCKFRLEKGSWRFDIIDSTTIKYGKSIRTLLSGIAGKAGRELMAAHANYGTYIGKHVNNFLKHYSARIDFISSHGHTIFHQPDNNVSFQLGHGAFISGITGLPVVCDFRQSDISVGGQGAPLVPIGDKLLFKKYVCCINLGGFSNISFDDSKGNRVAFDICPVNILLNYFAGKEGKQFDRNGSISKSGTINPGLLKKLNSLPYYSKSYPKSLGYENILSDFLPTIKKIRLSNRDVLRTLSEHVALQISKTIAEVFDNDRTKKKLVLVTGGGAHNKFLMQLIRNISGVDLCVPGKAIIDYKEALIFAFLGVLRWRNETNVYKSSTGAKRDSIAGAVYLPGGFS